MATLGELREATRHLPDSADVVVNLGDATYWELAGVREFPPVLEHPWCVALDTGSEVTLSFDLHHRDRND